eukprot:m.254396 g.254396  ORF g.254396 m.254396 type:complete len:119 (+) comp26731_c0_seq11:224-580(+)
MSKTTTQKHQQAKQQNIDECTIGADNCHIQADCINTVGSFNCVCKPGFIGDGVSCSDFPACERFPCPQFADCFESIGGPSNSSGRTCKCHPGYKLRERGGGKKVSLFLYMCLNDRLSL